MKKAPTQINEQRLPGTRTPDYTTASKGHNTSRKTLERTARRWVARGYYPTPSAAMQVLLEGVK